MEQIKTILFFYLLVLMCFIISATGVYLYDITLSKNYLSIILTFIPLISIITIFYVYYKAKK